MLRRLKHRILFRAPQVLGDHLGEVSVETEEDTGRLENADRFYEGTIGEPQFKHSSQRAASGPPPAVGAHVDAALAEDSRAGMSELATRLGVARNTVHAHFRRLNDSRVLRGFGARIDLEQLGVPVMAFVRVQLVQGAVVDVVQAIGRVPKVLEVCTTTGASNLMLRLACRSHTHLEDTLRDILTIRGVARSTTDVAVTTPVPYRILPLLNELTHALPERPWEDPN